VTKPSEPVRSPYSGAQPAEAASLPWPRLLVRTFLVVLPSQVVGTVLAAVLILLAGAGEHPVVGWSAWVVPAVVAAVVLGLLLRPDRGRVGRHAVAVAVVSTVVTVALVLVARGRVSSAGQPGVVSTLFPGLLVTVALETALAVALWVARDRPGR
jgi:hypothetical protein